MMFYILKILNHLIAGSLILLDVALIISIIVVMSVMLFKIIKKPTRENNKDLVFALIVFLALIFLHIAIHKDVNNEMQLFEKQQIENT